MNLDEEVAYKFQQDKRWTDNSIPYDYAYISIALGLSYAQAYGRPPKRSISQNRDSTRSR